MSRPSRHADVAAALGPWAGADRSRIEAVCDADRIRPATAIRLNSLAHPISPTDLPFVREPVPWAANRAFFVEPGARPGGHALYGTGAYYIQDASSLLAVSLLDPRPGEVIGDLCAAPGGKSTDILEALGQRGFLSANEVIRSRLGPLRLNLARHGGWRYAVSNLDPEELADRLGPSFDAVLVDAPCSGQSLALRGKQAGSAFDAKSVELNARRQKRILRAAGRLLQPGGRLVYSTCTYSWAENEQQVTAMLDAVPHEWHPDPLPQLEAFAARGPAPTGCYRLWPDRHGCAGAFAARLRYDPAAPLRTAQAPRGRKSNRGRALRHSDIPFDEWGRWNQRPTLLGEGRSCGVAPEQVPVWAASVGTLPQVAFQKGQSWFPAYGLAMRRDGAFEPKLRQPLSVDEASAYLAGQTGLAAQDGWCVCTFGGLALGWGKGARGTLKNHLPRSARLKID